jgi:alkylated DNA repair dioxygenase AlkB
MPEQAEMATQSDSELMPLDLPDAELLFCERVDLGEDPDALLNRLIDGCDWQQETVTLFGKTHLQPRLIAWYGDEGAAYTYSGTRHEPLPWTRELKGLREKIEVLTQSRYNSVLLNLYRNEKDAMGLHADDEPELGDEPVIASISLGEQRTLYFRHRHRHDLQTFNLPLPSASLLVMRGPTQRYWKHGIRKLRRPLGPRVNLTFRWIHAHPVKTG